MPTPIQRTVNGVLQDIKVSKVEEKQNERLKHIKEVVATIGEDGAQNMLQELETQLERSGSWSLRGYLRLAYTKDPNHRLEFERKTWIQMAWLKGRNAETEIAVQTAGKILLQKIEDKNDLSETLKKYFLVEEFSSNRGQKVKIETMRSYIHDLNVYCKDKIRAKTEAEARAKADAEASKNPKAEVDAQNEAKVENVVEKSPKQLEKVTQWLDLALPRSSVEVTDSDKAVEAMDNTIPQVDYLRQEKSLKALNLNDKSRLVSCSMMQGGIYEVYHSSKIPCAKRWVQKTNLYPEIEFKDGELFDKSGAIWQHEFHLSHQAFLPKIMSTIRVQLKANDKSPAPNIEITVNKESRNATIKRLKEYIESNQEIKRISVIEIFMPRSNNTPLEILLKSKDFQKSMLAFQLLDALQGLASQSWVHGGVALQNIFADPAKATIQITAPWEAKAIENKVLYNANPERLKEHPTCYDHPALALGKGVGFEQDLYSAGITLIMAYLMHTQGEKKSRQLGNELIEQFSRIHKGVENSSKSMNGKILPIVFEMFYKQGVTNIQEIITQPPIKGSSEPMLMIALELIQASLACNDEYAYDPLTSQEKYQAILKNIQSKYKKQ